MRKLITDLSMQPTSYIICIHVRNMRGTAGLTDNTITRIMSNLELTYGPEIVENTIRDFFPNFYVRYYNIEASTGDLNHNAESTGDLGPKSSNKPSRNDLKWDNLLKKLATK